MLAVNGCSGATAVGRPDEAPVGGTAHFTEATFQGSQLSVGLAFTLDTNKAKSDGTRVFAVIRDAKGQTYQTDLGVYEGRATNATPMGNELARVVVGDHEKSTVLVVVPTESAVEVRRSNAGSTEPSLFDELIYRLLIPKDVPVHGLHPALDLRP